MASASFAVDFQGYWREPNVGGVPNESGVYCVYTCRHNADDTVSLLRLIYIGEAEKARERIEGHERRPDWRKHVRSGEELCFSFGRVDPASRERVEAALIFHHKPPENVEYKGAFPFDRTDVTTKGRNALLADSLVVNRTP